ncbi:DUF3261 domain-containing protein [Acinetobacter sp. HY1485]|uniref:DUF3261 domain-containing protein n=1 Tax=Acinetobacter sp. HY1485 TaxID=2970918 RepID=UPI0022B94ACA|nr:DUF3261 domain-containing protein [Acinetobacter sp. HY1485]
MRLLKYLAISIMLAGCQLPVAKGLQNSAWQVQQYQRQDQLEVQWKNKSFSFLLYQQQQGKQLSMVALSLTGQQLFKLNFDGNTVKVEQRIDAMKLLPFNFLVRDILFATYPNFMPVNTQIKQNNATREIDIQGVHVLNIQTQTEQVTLNNIQVPYSIVFSAIPEGLDP